jgi:hypothetical protein
LTKADVGIDLSIGGDLECAFVGSRLWAPCRYDRLHHRSPTRRFHFDFSTELSKPFSHTPQSNPRRGPTLEASQNVEGNTLPIIGHRESDVSVVAQDAHIHGLGGGVAVHVGERFLQDAEQGDFNPAREPGDRFVDAE